ncbi:hypothetical protein JCM16106_05830 [Hydrogenophilus islandicus]
MQKLLFWIGVIALALSFLYPWLSKLPLGRLPGDIVIEKENFTFYFPITTSLVVSLLLSLLFWLWRK